MIYYVSIFLLSLVALSSSLQCFNGFEARIDGMTEFEMKDIVTCPATARYCVSGLNNMVKNVFLVGFTEMRVWGCEGERARFTSDIMPTCSEPGWTTLYDHLRHCCSGDLCNAFLGADPEGMDQLVEKLNLQDDFSKYVA